MGFMWGVGEWLLFNAIFFSNVMARTSYIRWDEDDVRFVLDQHTKLDFYCASLLKQQPMGNHVAPLGHIIMILSKAVIVFTP